jgi:hypothetical protein
MGDHQPSHRARNLGRLKYPVEDNEVTLYRPGITIREKVIVHSREVESETTIRKSGFASENRREKRLLYSVSRLLYSSHLMTRETAKD